MWPDIKIKSSQSFFPKVALKVASSVWLKKWWFSQLPKKTPNNWTAFVILKLLPRNVKIAQSGHTYDEWRSRHFHSRKPEVLLYLHPWWIKIIFVKAAASIMRSLLDKRETGANVINKFNSCIAILLLK